MSRDPRDDERGGSGGGGWIDRHLGKIVGVVFALCLLGLVARALTG
jgi:hypothetical protein